MKLLLLTLLGVTASFRGVSVTGHVMWASGSGGSWIRLDPRIKKGVVPGAEKLDFRGIHAFDADNVILMSSGTGELSKVFRTTDGGDHWTLLFTNPDPKGFFDAIQFWDKRHGIIAGDPVDGKFTIFTTNDAGGTWTRQTGFPALPDEGAFAASNSCLTVRGSKDAWLGTGGGRILHSTDGGVTWTATDSGIRHGNANAGVFSIAWANARTGIAAGGDYRKDQEGWKTISRTEDGGKTWRAMDGRGYRSAVTYSPKRKLWIITGTSGTDVSNDDGKTWKPIDDGSFNALSDVWAVGTNGRVGRLN